MIIVGTLREEPDSVSLSAVIETHQVRINVKDKVNNVLGEIKLEIKEGAVVLTVDRKVYPNEEAVEIKVCTL